MGAPGGTVEVSASAGPGRDRWCSIDARIGSTRLGSAVGVECFDHGPTLAYWGGVGQSAVKGVAIGCQGRLSRQGRLTSHEFICPVSPLLLPTPAGSRHPSGSWGIPVWRVLRPEWGDPSFRWDDGDDGNGGSDGVAGATRMAGAAGDGKCVEDGSTVGRHRSLPCSPAKAGAQTGSPPSRGNKLWFEAISAPNPPPRRRPGPSWGPAMISAVLRYLDLSNWAPALAGVAPVGAGRGKQR